MKDGHLETKDLMIGDWVSYTECEYYRKVSSIDPLMERVGLGYINLNTFPSYDYCDLHAVNPIPLTPKILEKNEFEKYSEYYYLVLGDPSLTLKKEINGYQIGHLIADVYEPFILIKYVHELQHALRLCGLTELAENFKV